MSRKCICIKSHNHNDVDYIFGHIYKYFIYSNKVIHVYSNSKELEYVAFEDDPESGWSFYKYYMKIEEYREFRINQVIND